MEQQYITRFAEAYKRGYEKKYAGVDNAPENMFGKLVPPEAHKE